MKVLLDTHTLLWATLSPKLLSRRAATIIADHANLVLVSAASAWEIATKVRLGKLPGAEHLEARFVETLEAAGYTMLAIDVENALGAGRLPSQHGDPFDRMIAATALAADMPVLSKDEKLDSFGIRRIW